MSYARFLFVAAVFILGAGRAAAAPVPCVNGFAGPYACDKVDLLYHVALPAVGADSGATGNDVWGWTDPVSGREYALLGLSNATAFVDITDPENPIYVGRLQAPAAGACVPSLAGEPPAFTPDHEEDCPSNGPAELSPTHEPEHCSSNSLWRDLEVYADHVFIGSEQQGHGLIVFDLRQLRAFAPPRGRRPPVNFTPTARYCGYGSSHTTSINTTTGFLYANGSTTCNGGPHIVDIRNPAVPVGVGCDSANGYTHDSQCFVYQGPDVAHQGQSICINCNGRSSNPALNRLVISNETNPAAPATISSTGYAGAGYTHQGWVTADHRYYLLDDELDEENFGGNTKTYVWDLLDLEAPQLMSVHLGPTPAIDHQQFVHGNFTYQSNYRAGLRMLETKNIAAGGQIDEVGYFDVYPPDNNTAYGGTWANYPFFRSGSVALTTIGPPYGTGTPEFFVVRPRFADLKVTVTDSPDPVVLGQDVTYTFSVLDQGPTRAANVVFTDALPASMTLISATPATCMGTSTVTCPLGTVQNGAVATVTIVARANAVGTITNSGIASSDETDTRLNDNTGTAQTTVNSSVQASAGKDIGR
jgi:choice-of-anchor B domain-containing protein